MKCNFCLWEEDLFLWQLKTDIRWAKYLCTKTTLHHSSNFISIFSISMFDFSYLLTDETKPFTSLLSFWFPLFFEIQILSHQIFILTLYLISNFIHLFIFLNFLFCFSSSSLLIFNFILLTINFILQKNQTLLRKKKYIVHG
jgi:hypothetical protein